jgi:hypothetical protein
VKKSLLFLSALALAAFLPSVASAQLATDINGEKTQSEVKIGTNGSNYSDGRSSQVGFVDAFTRLGNHAIVEGLVQGGQYFGSDFAGAGGSVILTGRGLLYGDDLSGSYLQVGGFVNSHTQTTSAYNAFIEAGTLVYRAKSIVGPQGVAIRDGFIKAVELDYNQTWQGFGLAPVNTDVHSFSPRVIVYLPKGFDLMVRGGLVDIIQNGVHNPKPSGGARLRVPVTRRLSLTASAGFDSEGITNIAQIASYSTRNYGAGAAFWLNRTTSVEAEGYTSLYTANKLSGNTYRITLRKRF